MNKCGHSEYWIATYGNCMACRAEKAEKRLAVIESALDVFFTSCGKPQSPLGWLVKTIDKFLGERP